MDIVTISNTLQRLGGIPLSYSKVKTLEACPRKYGLQYITKKDSTDLVSAEELRARQEAAQVGKFVHKVLEYCISRGKYYGFDEEAVDFDLTWHQVAKQMRLLKNEYDRAQAIRYNTEQILLRIVKMINTYRMEVIPEMRLMLNRGGEYTRNAKFNNRLLYGYLDFVGIKSNGKEAIILDYKTHGLSGDHIKAVEEQMMFYVYMLFMKYKGLELVQPGGVYIPDEAIRLCEPITKDSFYLLKNTFVSRLQKFSEILETCLDTKNFTAVKNDLCNWCNYIDDCPEHKSKKKSV